MSRKLKSNSDPLFFTSSFLRFSGKFPRALGIVSKKKRNKNIFEKCEILLLKADLKIFLHIFSISDKKF